MLCFNRWVLMIKGLLLCLGHSFLGFNGEIIQIHILIFFVKNCYC